MGSPRPTIEQLHSWTVHAIIRETTTTLGRLAGGHEGEEQGVQLVHLLQISLLIRLVLQTLEWVAG